MVDAEMANYVKADSIEVGIEITAPDGSKVYSGRNKLWNYRRQKVREFRLDSIAVDNALLWDCENPNLYTLEATIYRPDGTVADKVTERFGIRSIEFSPEFGMKLNGAAQGHSQPSHPWGTRRRGLSRRHREAHQAAQGFRLQPHTLVAQPL